MLHPDIFGCNGFGVYLDGNFLFASEVNSYNKIMNALCVIILYVLGGNEQ